jgi:hypothetical protein
MYTKLVYTISVTALTKVPLKVINEGKKPKDLPPKAKSSTLSLEVIRPRIIPSSVNPTSTPIKVVEPIITAVFAVKIR